jgi:hypothetical protein
MKKYTVFLLAIVLLLALQSSDIQAGGFVRGGFAPRSFAGPTGHRFASRSVIVINPARQVVRFSPIAHRFVVVPRHFVGNTVISSPAGRQTRLHGFHRRGFFVGDGFFGGDGGVAVTGEQPQLTEIIQPQEPVHKGRYVQPRWVDGGNGVQVSEPGYWTDH